MTTIGLAGGAILLLILRDLMALNTWQACQEQFGRAGAGETVGYIGAPDGLAPAQGGAAIPSQRLWPLHTEVGTFYHGVTDCVGRVGLAQVRRVSVGSRTSLSQTEVCVSTCSRRLIGEVRVPAAPTWIGAKPKQQVALTSDAGTL